MSCACLEAVKESCSTQLVKAWLDTYSGDKLTLLGLLDVENSLDITQLLLNMLFSKSTPDELTTGLEILDDAYVFFLNNFCTDLRASIIFSRVELDKSSDCSLMF